MIDRAYVPKNSVNSPQAIIGAVNIHTINMLFTHLMNVKMTYSTYWLYKLVAHPRLLTRSRL